MKKIHVCVHPGSEADPDRVYLHGNPEYSGEEVLLNNDEEIAARILRTSEIGSGLLHKVAQAGYRLGRKKVC